MSKSEPIRSPFFKADLVLERQSNGKLLVIKNKFGNLGLRTSDMPDEPGFYMRVMTEGGYFWRKMYDNE